MSECKYKCKCVDFKTENVNVCKRIREIMCIWERARKRESEISTPGHINLIKKMHQVKEKRTKKK